MSLVGIVPLSGLGNLQIGLDTMNDLLEVYDIDDHRVFQKAPSWDSLDNFCVREFIQWQALIPIVLVVHHTCMEHILEHLVHSLCLTNGL
jgi:hypothetical protein